MPVDRLTATDCNAAARANRRTIARGKLGEPSKKKVTNCGKVQKVGGWVSGIIQIVYISKYRLFCIRGGGHSGL